MSTIRMTAAALMLAATAAHAAEVADGLPPPLRDGKTSLDLRMRTEHVDNDAAATPGDSTATTLRARLGFTTAKWNGLGAALEYEGVTAYDKVDYNDGTAASAQVQRPAVADPAGGELNQAWVRFSGIPMTTLQGGRLRLALDNHRWVGNVGWRQNEQTYDGAVLVNRTLPGTELTYAYVHNVNSFLFTNVPLRANVVNGAFSPGSYLKASLYSYWLDFEAPNAGNRQDGQTLGLRLTGTPALTDAAKLLYTAEYARQRAYEEAPATVDVDYILTELGAILGATQVKLGYEVLGSNDGLYAVQAPLATLHAHDGWADLFLVTPAPGLRDVYASVSTTAGGVALVAAAHRFSADYGGAEYGEELDVSAGYAFNRQLSALLKYAAYDATAVAGASSFAGNFDTEKGWVQLEYRF